MGKSRTPSDATADVNVRPRLWGQKLTVHKAQGWEHYNTQQDLTNQTKSFQVEAQGLQVGSSS